MNMCWGDGSLMFDMEFFVECDYGELLIAWKDREAFRGGIHVRNKVLCRDAAVLLARYVFALKTATDKREAGRG